MPVIWTSDREDDIQLKFRIENGLTIVTKQGVNRRHSKSDDQVRDIDELPQFIHDAYEDYQNRNGVSRAKWVPVKYMAPKEAIESQDTQSDVVLMRVVSRERFNTSVDGDRRPRNPLLRETVEHPDDSNMFLKIYGMKRTNMVEFSVYSTHSKRANMLAIDFERFMHAYKFYFTARGFNRVLFEDRGEDTIKEIGATEFHIRPIQFRVDTEMLYFEVSAKLQEIILKYDVGSKLKTTVLDEATVTERHEIDRGPS